MTGYKLIRIKDTSNEDYDLLEIMHSLREFVTEYHWSVSDLEVCKKSNVSSETSSKIDQASNSILWITGDELCELAKSIECTNWGAFLAFKKSDAGFQYQNIPYSEGKPPSIQHPLAQIEIQAVDGGDFEVFTTINEIRNLLEKSFEVESITSRID